MMDDTEVLCRAIKAAAKAPAGQTVAVSVKDLGALLGLAVTTTRERDEARAEAERLRAAVNAALLIAHTAPPPVHAAHWCLRLVETLRNAIKTDGAP